MYLFSLERGSTIWCAEVNAVSGCSHHTLRRFRDFNLRTLSLYDTTFTEFECRPSRHGILFEIRANELKPNIHFGFDCLIPLGFLRDSCRPRRWNRMWVNIHHLLSDSMERLVALALLFAWRIWEHFLKHIFFGFFLNCKLINESKRT